jgi:hypothetical protein
MGGNGGNAGNEIPGRVDVPHIERDRRVAGPAKMIDVGCPT